MKISLEEQDKLADEICKQAAALVYDAFEPHVGHRTELIFHGGYGKDNSKITLECLTCNKVIMRVKK
jgi:hypothetical protein